ncbi:hypothetical protein SUGI_1105340 [Cryptomeria japonica]|nr:hypothetical protein SUGI_1105340 [Cryptomeria japonica]
MNQATLRSADISLDSTIPAISKSSDIESALQQSAQLEQWKGVYGVMEFWKVVYGVMELWKVVYRVMEFIGLFRDRPFSPQLCATESALQQTVPAQQSNKAACETFDSEKSDIESGFEQTASTRQIDGEMEEAVKHKWKFVNCALAFFGISLVLFGADFRSNSRASTLVVEICLSSVSLISGVLFYIIYLKICKEEQLRISRSQVSGRSYQFLLFSLAMCLTFGVYILIGISAAKKL